MPWRPKLESSRFNVQACPHAHVGEGDRFCRDVLCAGSSGADLLSDGIRNLQAVLPDHLYALRPGPAGTCRVLVLFPAGGPFQCRAIRVQLACHAWHHRVDVFSGNPGEFFDDCSPLEQSSPRRLSAAGKPDRHPNADGDGARDHDDLPQAIQTGNCDLCVIGCPSRRLFDCSRFVNTEPQMDAGRRDCVLLSARDYDSRIFPE